MQDLCEPTAGKATTTARPPGPCPPITRGSRTIQRSTGPLDRCGLKSTPPLECCAILRQASALPGPQFHMSCAHSHHWTWHGVSIRPVLAVWSCVLPCLSPFTDYVKMYPIPRNAPPNPVPPQAADLPLAFTENFLKEWFALELSGFPILAL